MKANFFTNSLRQIGASISFKSSAKDKAGIKEKVTTTFSGWVVDENNVSIFGAQVQCSGHVTTTDKFGYFTFNHIIVDKDKLYVKVVKPGFFTGTRAAIPAANSQSSVRIMLTANMKYTSASAENMSNCRLDYV